MSVLLSHQLLLAWARLLLAGSQWTCKWDHICSAFVCISTLMNMVINAQTGIEVLGVVENMSGLSQRLSAFNFLTTAPDGSQQDVTQQLLQHLPPHLQASTYR